MAEDVKNTSATFAQKMSAAEERVVVAEQRLTEAQTEWTVEREWRQSLQRKQSEYKEQFENLSSHIKELKEKLRVSEKLKCELDEMHRLRSEAEHTMEELGIQLSESKLKIAELEEEKQYLIKNVTDIGEHFKSATGSTTVSSFKSTQSGRVIPGACGIWAPDSIATHCASCRRDFNLTRRKHHCRSCGEIFCNTCSEHTLPVQLNDDGQLGKPVRVCSACFEAHK